MSSTLLGQASDLVRALVARRARLSIPRGPRARARVLARQRARLARLLEHAAERSPLYRARFGGRVPRPEDLPHLEPIDKSELFGARFDQALTNRRWSRASLAARLGRGARGGPLVVATSGTSGTPALVPYARSEWILGVAAMLRAAPQIFGHGLWRALPRAARSATIFTHNPVHVSTQVALALDPRRGGGLQLSAGAPIDELVSALQAFQPTLLAAYPSALELLLAEERAGRLAIRPEVVLSGGETLSPHVRARAGERFGAEVFDFYGLSETLLAAGECRAHQGLHVNEDLVLLEVVDERDRPLPPGETGAGLLVTNLFNRTLPIVRYRVSDQLVLDEQPCACGLPFARIRAIEGRREEILELDGACGARVRVHPFAVETPLEEIEGVARFQLRAEPGRLRVLVVPAGDAEALRRRLEPALAAALAPFGLAPNAVRLELIDSIALERGASDKRRRVERDGVAD